ncbi:hypothetical protein ASB57_22630 [Bordetella sp. N]|nr:hypothetical protein ASB57_22630 [Bordetella sp. N]
MGLVIAGCGGGGGGDDDKGFDLTASTDGKAVAGFAVSDGQTGTLNVNSGEVAVLQSSAGVTWTVVSADPVVSYTQVSDPTDSTLRYQLSSAQGGNIVLSVASKEDGNLKATVTVVVAPQQYTPKDAVLGARSTYTVADNYVNGTTKQSSYTRETTVVNPDGSYTSSSFNSANVVTDTYTANAEGNRLTRTYVSGDPGSNGNLCTYTPSREWLNFPIYVGKTWSSTWQYACAFGYKETANLNATVLNAESVTVPAGVFNALRVQFNTALTDSNDSALTNGTTGTAKYNIATIAWYVPTLGQYVKFERTYTYTGAQPSLYINTEVEQLQSQSQPQ